MGEINLAPLIVEIVRTFFASARNSLERLANLKSLERRHLYTTRQRRVGK